MKKIIFVMACVLSLLGVGVNTHAATTTISGNISSIQMIGKTVTKSHSKAEIEYTAINKNSVRGVCQEKCVSLFVSFFTSVNLFCYLQIYHHHF